jgi:hypothetical protein
MARQADSAPRHLFHLFHDFLGYWLFAQRRLRSQHPFHKDQIEPTFEFPTYFPKVSDRLETCFSVQSETGFVSGIDSCYHCMITRRLSGI